VAPRSQRGSGWFEFAVAAVLLSVLAAILVRQLVEYQALAEQTAVDLTLRNLRSGLRWQVAERLLRGRAGELAGLEGANPVAWLERPPLVFRSRAAPARLCAAPRLDRRDVRHGGGAALAGAGPQVHRGPRRKCPCRRPHSGRDGAREMNGGAGNPATDEMLNRPC
jgi:hypothetical protein